MKTKKETHIIDASGKVLGRLATQIAILLRGKHKPNFDPSKDMGDFVVITGIEKIKVTGNKANNKKYIHHTGYLGGLKEKKFKEVFEKNPAFVLKKAVLGMLPKNKLRPRQIKRLTFE
jgi:large subunit ribosomal protein L13